MISGNSATRRVSGLPEIIEFDVLPPSGLINFLPRSQKNYIIFSGYMMVYMMSSIRSNHVFYGPLRFGAANLEGFCGALSQVNPSVASASSLTCLSLNCSERGKPDVSIVSTCSQELSISKPYFDISIRFNDPIN